MNAGGLMLFAASGEERNRIPGKSNGLLAKLDSFLM